MTHAETTAPARPGPGLWVALAAALAYVAAFGWVIATGTRLGPAAFLPVAVPLALYVAWSDMARMKIPNQAVLVCAAAFVLLGPLVLPWGEYGWRLVQGVAVLAVGFALNMARVLGAGDAKFGAAIAPYFAGADAPLVLIMAAALLFGAFAAHRLARALPFVRRLAPGWESWTHAKFPMGLALGPLLPLYLVLVAAV